MSAINAHRGGLPHEIEQDLTRFLGSRGASAVGAILLFLVGGSTAAHAQAPAQASIIAAPPAGFDLRTQALIEAVARSAVVSAPVAYQAGAAPRAAVPLTALPGGDAYAVTIHRDPPTLQTAITELASLVDANGSGDLDEEASCLATAVYFESKGEPLEGQLAVAQVVLNRAASGRYPASLCGVVKQHAQFSFVRAGVFPAIDVSCAAWRKARAIARIATKRLVAGLPADVLWYHADYVAPRWRQALVKVEKIGAHIFYRA